MYSDTHPPLQHHKEQFFCPKASPCATISSLSRYLASTDLFTVPTVCLFQKVTKLESYSMPPFQIGFFHFANRCLSFFHIVSWPDGSLPSIAGLVFHCVEYR